MPESCLYRLWVFDSKNAISFANTAMQTIITGDVNFGNETSKSSCWKPKKHPLVSYHSGDKRYEITNHLGKVQAVLSDRVLVVSQGLKDFGGIPANAAGLTADSGTSISPQIAGSVIASASLPNSSAPITALVNIPLTDLRVNSICNIIVGVEASYTTMPTATNPVLQLAATSLAGHDAIFHIHYLHVTEDGVIRRPEPQQVTDYYPYGMEKPGRGSNPYGYRYGFNGAEADNALMSGRNSYSFTYRFYDTRTARWTKRDPYTSFYTAFSPYHFAAGNPIVFIDSEGLKIEWANDEQTQKHRKAILRLVNSNQNFAQLYTMLDNMQEIFYVDGGPNGQSKIKEEENKYGNVLMRGFQYRQNIFLAIVANESTYFEEFFHQLQAIIENNLNYEKLNSRNAREAEYVLFMSLIGETDLLSSKSREIADSYAYDALQTMRQQIAIEGYISPSASLNKMMQQFTNNFTNFYSSNPLYSQPGIVEQGPVATSEFTKTTFEQNKIDSGYGGSGMGQKHFSDSENIEDDNE